MNYTFSCRDRTCSACVDSKVPQCSLGTNCPSVVAVTPQQEEQSYRRYLLLDIICLIIVLLRIRFFLSTYIFSIIKF